MKSKMTLEIWWDELQPFVVDCGRTRAVGSNERQMMIFTNGKHELVTPDGSLAPPPALIYTAYYEGV